MPKALVAALTALPTIAAASRPLLVHRGLPPLPSGRSVTLELANLEDAGTGGTVWSSSHALCRWVAANLELRGASVLELGCGTGACGIFAAGLGARLALLTDGGPPGVLALARRNIDRNRGLYPSASVTTASYAFGEPLPSGDFDFVLGSDVAYHGGIEPLALTVRRLLEASSPPRVLLSAPDRSEKSGASLTQRLIGTARELGLCTEVKEEAVRQFALHESLAAEAVRTSVLELSLDRAVDAAAVEVACMRVNAKPSPAIF